MFSDSLRAHACSSIGHMDRSATAAGVLEAARGLELLDDDGGLKPLDSLNVLDMVVELERLLAIEIPADVRLPEGFGKPQIAMPGVLVVEGPAVRSQELRTRYWTRDWRLATGTLFIGRLRGDWLS